MRVTKKTTYWVIAFAVVFITFLYGYVLRSDNTKSQNSSVPVEVETVTSDSIQETIELTGWIKANKVVEVTSKVAGRIESLELILDDGSSVSVEEGLTVKKGQQIAVIDHDVYLAQLAAAEAQVRARKVELADAEREKKRVVALYESGSATEQNRDKAVTAAELAKASLSLAEANLELAQINLRESTIVSPIDGVVVAKHVDQGNLIGQGQRIVMIADMKVVKVVVALAEKYGSQVHPGMQAMLKVDTYEDRVFDAQVYSIYPALDPKTHTIQAEIRFTNDKLLLKPGMFARVTLITRRAENTVVIPRDVILGGKIDRHYVYVVEDGIAHKRLVNLGVIESERCEITEGLMVGETLVVNGMHYLTDGVSVEIVRIEDIK